MRHLIWLIFFLWMLSTTPSLAQKTGDYKALLDRLARGDKQAAAAVVREGEAIFPDLAKLLATQPRDDNQSIITSAVAEIASKIGPKAKVATPTLCVLLKSQDKVVAGDCARALGYIGAAAAPEVVETLKAIENQPQQAANAVRALRHIGPSAKGAAPTLLALLRKNTDPHFRLACIDALASIGGGGNDAVAELLQLAKADKKNVYAVHLIVALGSQGGDGKAATDYLAEVMKNAPEPHLRIHAMDSLARISPNSKEARDAVVKMLDQPHLPRVLVLESLSKGGVPGKEVLKVIEQLMRDKDSAVALQAALVVGKANKNHPAVVSILIESLQARDATTRRTAAQAIGAIRPDDGAVIEALLARANDADPAVRKAVADALAKFKKK